MADDKVKELEQDGLLWLKLNPRPRLVIQAAAAYGMPPLASEQYEFDVVLVEVKPEDRMRVCAALRRLNPSLGLAEALALTKDLPRAIIQGVGKAEAFDKAKQLDDAGAKTRLR